jgi:hypothetical protein
LGGCNNPSGIGLDVDPNLALNTTIVDTSTVIAKLFKKDSVVANYTYYSALGYFKDPIFGTTTSNIALALTLPSDNYTFGKSPVLDSAILVLPYKDFYGDSVNTNYTIEVKQLGEVLYTGNSNSYYNTKKWTHGTAVLGSKNTKAIYKDSIIIQDIISGKKDTIKKVIPQLRIALDPTFITNNILKTDSLNLLSKKVFSNYFKGLYVSLNKNTTTNNGGVFLLDTYTSGAARLDLYYKKTSSTGTKDTVNVSLNISGAGGDAVSEMTWDITGTAVQTELQSTAKTSNNLYLKGLSGTEVKVEFPYLSKLKTLGKNIAINRAELILQVESGTETPYKPIARLRAYRWDIAERPQLIPDESPTDLRYLGFPDINGYYNKTTKSYTFNFTAYIQDLMNGKTKNYGTFITTTDFTSAANVFNTLGRSKVGGNTGTYKAKLKIYYTDLK